MTSSSRDPLAPLSLNQPRVSASPSSPASTKPRILAPIFNLRKNAVASSSSSPSPSRTFASSSQPHGAHTRDHARLGVSGAARKRARLNSYIRPDTPSVESEDDDEAELMDVDGEADDGSLRAPSGVTTQYRAQRLTDWFCAVKPETYRSEDKEPKRASARNGDAGVEPSESSSSWTRSRRRTGRAAFRYNNLAYYQLQEYLDMPYLNTLVRPGSQFNPNAPPSAILLPSLHPPNGQPRFLSPGLAVAFNPIAKHYDASAARDANERRLLAVASDEGGLRIVDVDEDVGEHREKQGWWWRGHANTVYDIKWSADGRNILTASGDFTSRIHALDGAQPTCLAVLKGHTCCVKSATFFDPSRSMTDASFHSSIIASGGRDGNILIFDIRCKGRSRSVESSCASSASAGSGSESDDSTASGRSRRGAQRYSDAVPGFAPSKAGSEIHPVMVLKQPHGDGTRRHTPARTVAQSVTSLLALQAMPGILASGGAADGAVKLWDIRFPDATKRSPDPRPICSAWSRLDDPTIQGSQASRRPRSINSLAENPATGDIYALCADSKIHVLRPSVPVSTAASNDPFGAAGAGGVVHERTDCIVPGTYSDDKLFARGFYFKIAISPDGKYLASASGRGGMMTWDLENTQGRGSAKATRFSIADAAQAQQQQQQTPALRERETSAIDWGKDMVAACSDDYQTRIWRSDIEVARRLRADPEGAAADQWFGASLD